MVNLEKKQEMIPTYPPKKPHPLPMFFENKPYQGASGRVYPIPYSDGITDQKQEAAYEIYTLENEYIQTKIAPSLGGKILRGYDKRNGYDFIYYNEVIKPALVGLAGPWISGGIEFNWPQHHRPTTFMPMEAETEENADGSKTVWVGEVEPLGRMKGMVGITLEPGRSYIKAKVRLYNRTSLPQVFMWWANLAVPVNDSYRTVFPPDVEWVNDHDRRAVLSWPIAKGVYQTARSYNFGDGTDISQFAAIKVPSSYLVSQGQSDMNFVAGYDTGLQKGIVTVADHHIAPGKKMWHWGKGDFGNMWCSNLTDKNGPYIELMTGVYTDNQPDFTWIAPYETKEFEQVWFPIHDLENVVNATADAAMNLEQRGEEYLLVFQTTGCFERAKISVVCNGKEIFSEQADMNPSVTYKKLLPLQGNKLQDLTVSLSDAEGKCLVAYHPYIRGKKQPITVRKPVARPSEIAGNEELFLNGLHLEQYKQHNYRPEDYYLEGIRRDHGDSRCNTAMARLSLKNGQFEQCISYASAAITRLTCRNQHPTDTEAFYLLGLAQKYSGQYDQAYDSLFRASWSYTYHSAAMYELACIDCIRGDYNSALEHCSNSLLLQPKHTKAKNLLTAIYRHIGDIEKAKQNEKEADGDDLLDIWASAEHYFVTGEYEKLQSVFGGKSENYIVAAGDYLNAGMVKEAMQLLQLDGHEDPMKYYYAYACSVKMGVADESLRKKAEALPTDYCFPSRLEDIAVLQCAMKQPDCGKACYYLGCLYYDKFRYKEAADLWEKSAGLCPENYMVWRNLAFAYFDKQNRPEEAQKAMQQALRCNDRDPRLLMEYEQLLKNRNRPIEERLAVYEKYPALLKERDDCYLDRIILWCQQGKYQQAIDSAKAKRFHIYEGGEGKLTKQHAWMYVLYGNELKNQGKLAEAEQSYLDGVNMPKSYGEAKTFFNQEAHIFYYLGILYEQQGKPAEAHKAFEEASVYKAAISELSLFRGLALEKLGQKKQAEQIWQEMLDSAENTLRNKDLRTYYGVGSPSPMPFELDIIKNNTREGNILKAFAFLGFGKRAEAQEALAQAIAVDPNDFRIYAFRKIAATLE